MTGCNKVVKSEVEKFDFVRASHLYFTRRVKKASMFLLFVFESQGMHLSCKITESTTFTVVKIANNSMKK